MNEWEAKYRALCQGVNDKDLIDKAEYLVERAVKISVSSQLNFWTVFHALSTMVSRLRPLPDLEKLKSLDPQKFLESGSES